MAHQYILDIVPPQEKKIFCQGSFNERAIQILQKWPTWPSRVVSIYGPSGSGKTYLLHLWGKSIGAFFASQKDISSFRENRLFHDAKVIILDELDMRQEEEESLFHFYNWIGEQKKYLVIVSVHSLAQWQYTLKDLESRFKSVPSFAIGVPKDDVLRDYMRQYFESYQLVVSDLTLESIFRRLERSFGVVAEFCVYLNQSALRFKRPISRGLALEALESFLAESSELLDAHTLT